MRDARYAAGTLTQGLFCGRGRCRYAVQVQALMNNPAAMQQMQQQMMGMGGTGGGGMGDLLGAMGGIGGMAPPPPLPNMPTMGTGFGGNAPPPPLPNMPTTFGANAAAGAGATPPVNNLANMFAPGGLFGGLGAAGTGGGPGPNQPAATAAPAVDAATGMSEEEMLAEAIRRSMDPGTGSEPPRE